MAWRHILGVSGSAQEKAVQSRVKGQCWLGGRPAAPCREASLPRAHTELISALHSSLQLLHLPLTISTEYWRKPRKTPEHRKARTGNLTVHQAPSAAPRPYGLRDWQKPALTQRNTRGLFLCICGMLNSKT